MLPWRIAHTHKQTHIHGEGNINQRLIMHTCVWIYCHLFRTTSQFNFLCCFSQWLYEATARWDGEKTEQGEGEEDEGSLDGWKEWRNRSIFLNVTCSASKASWRTWANVNEWEGETDGRGGGRKRGENIWHTGGGGSMWVIGRRREEGREQNWGRRGNRIQQKRDAHLCLGSVKMQEMKCCCCNLPTSSIFTFFSSISLCWLPMAV